MACYAFTTGRITIMKQDIVRAHNFAESSLKPVTTAKIANCKERSPAIDPVVLQHLIRTRACHEQRATLACAVECGSLDLKRPGCPEAETTSVVTSISAIIQKHCAPPGDRSPPLARDTKSPRNAPLAEKRSTACISRSPTSRNPLCNVASVKAHSAMSAKSLMPKL